MSPRLSALLLTLCGVALGSYRFDPARILVEIDMSFEQFVQQVDPTRTAFDRNDFEMIDRNKLQIWATKPHRDLLTTRGIRWTNGVDHGAATFAAEVNRSGGRYMDTPNAEPIWTEYCGYECMTARLSALIGSGGCSFPVQLYNIGETVQKRKIWVLKIGGAGPQVLMAGNIHGDETTGGQLLQRWVWETCNQPSIEQGDLARSVQAYYMPMFNPDGYESNSRGNANGADLNRAFPKPGTTNGASQPEAKAYIDFTSTHNFDVSLMYHGGAVVCNYAYDSCYTDAIVPRPCPPASTAMHRRGNEVIPSADAYARAYIAGGGSCNVGQKCLVNGAAWYVIEGSMQDWAFYFRNTLDMTMEVSSVKRVSATDLPKFYESNKEAIHKFMMYSVESKNGVGSNSTRNAHPE